MRSGPPARTPGWGCMAAAARRAGSGGRTGSVAARVRAAAAPRRVNRARDLNAGACMGSTAAAPQAHDTMRVTHMCPRCSLAASPLLFVGRGARTPRTPRKAPPARMLLAVEGARARAQVRHC